MKVLSTLALALLSPLAHTQALSVTFNGLEHDQGQVAVAVYADPKSSLKENQAFTARKVKAEMGAVTLVFRDVPPGRYAVLAYHDENDNGELDRRFGMFFRGLRAVEQSQGDGPAALRR